MLPAPAVIPRGYDDLRVRIGVLECHVHDLQHRGWLPIDDIANRCEISRLVASGLAGLQPMDWARHTRIIPLAAQPLSSSALSRPYSTTTCHRSAGTRRGGTALGAALPARRQAACAAGGSSRCQMGERRSGPLVLDGLRAELGAWRSSASSARRRRGRRRPRRGSGRGGRDGRRRAGIELRARIRRFLIRRLRIGRRGRCFRCGDGGGHGLDRIRDETLGSPRGGPVGHLRYCLDINTCR
jgi:hypothetical protein